MGTTWSAQIVGAPSGVEECLQAVLARVIGSMSQWDSGSALSRFNTSRIGEWRELPADLAYVLTSAMAVGARTGGAFNPAQGALTDLWGFGASGRHSDVPSEAEIDEARADGAIEVDRLHARRTGPVQLDLSGIAKGYAVDALAQTLREMGVRDYLVEIGGEWVGSGISPDGQPWWVELESPPNITLAPFRIALHSLAVATSGNYRRFISDGGRRLSHTIDPRTGYPIDNDVVSVSVIAADCMTADAWATALTVLGCEEGLAVAARENLAARIVMKDGREMLSPALMAMLD